MIFDVDVCAVNGINDVIDEYIVLDDIWIILCAGKRSKTILLCQDKSVLVCIYIRHVMKPDRRPSNRLYCRRDRSYVILDGCPAYAKM